MAIETVQGSQRPDCVAALPPGLLRVGSTQWKNEGAFTYDRRRESRRKVDDLPRRGSGARTPSDVATHTASGGNNGVSIRRRRVFPMPPKPPPPEATEAATAATAHVAGTATHGYEATREAAMAAFAKSGARLASTPGCEASRNRQNFPVIYSSPVRWSSRSTT
jgi:hypothetical protein